MGALPKNKITRVERGKRRRGNTPSLKKDTNASVPLHKRGLVAQILQKSGLSPKQASTEGKRKRATNKKAVAAVSVDSKAAAKPLNTAVKKTARTTQHKG
ncbi:hypothetical protein KBC79_03060 [Candidatus Woesebacteria bacterium]|nr:hypothetical protein [Candidatus Woesebacteria bacterium]